MPFEEDPSHSTNVDLMQFDDPRDLEFSGGDDTEPDIAPSLSNTNTNDNLPLVLYTVNTVAHPDFWARHHTACIKVSLRA